MQVRQALAAGVLRLSQAVFLMCAAVCRAVEKEPSVPGCLTRSTPSEHRRVKFSVSTLDNSCSNVVRAPQPPQRPPAPALSSIYTSQFVRVKQWPQCVPQEAASSAFSLKRCSWQNWYQTASLPGFVIQPRPKYASPGLPASGAAITSSEDL